MLSFYFILIYKFNFYKIRFLLYSKELWNLACNAIGEMFCNAFVLIMFIRIESNLMFEIKKKFSSNVRNINF